ncbi:hypothetical protein [Frisingicoccus sp.]|uniref:hypothetical protein n=1 Tax=Frisingicoccus sp. TaxID=1918627 RepID=UPI00386793BF
MNHYLSGQSSLIDILYTTNIRNLHMIFAEPVSLNPLELLESNNFSIAISKLKSVHDSIIIDAPILGSFIDAVVITNECDGSILVVVANSIIRRFAKK